MQGNGKNSPAARHDAPTQRASTIPPSHGTIRVGSLMVEYSIPAVRVAGRTVALTARQTALLCYLAERAGRWMSARELLVRACRAEHAESSVVRVHICELRKRLGCGAHLLESRKGFGYRLRSADDAEYHNA
jgi:DNA-binding response OmpR family regulator